MIFVVMYQSTVQMFIVVKLYVYNYKKKKKNEKNDNFIITILCYWAIVQVQMCNVCTYYAFTFIIEYNNCWYTYYNIMFTHQ